MYSVITKVKDYVNDLFKFTVTMKCKGLSCKGKRKRKQEKFTYLNDSDDQLSPEPSEIRISTNSAFLYLRDRSIQPNQRRPQYDLPRGGRGHRSRSTVTRRRRAIKIRCLRLWSRLIEFINYGISKISKKAASGTVKRGLNLTYPEGRVITIGGFWLWSRHPRLPNFDISIVSKNHSLRVKFNISKTVWGKNMELVGADWAPRGLNIPHERVFKKDNISRTVSSRDSGSTCCDSFRRDIWIPR